jgi:hypothetical protein
VDHISQEPPLSHIEESCFWRSSWQSIAIPEKVVHTDESAFVADSIEPIFLDKSNEHFKRAGKLLVDMIEGQ